MTALHRSGKSLSISNDLEIRALPPGLNLENLHIRHCPRLRSLGDDLRVSGNLTILHCGLLESIPENLGLKGRLRLAGCSSLKGLPLGLVPQTIELKHLHFGDDGLALDPQFQGDIRVILCGRLDQLEVPSRQLRNVELASWDLFSLPANLRVSGNMFLYDLPLAEVPRGLHVHGDLTFARGRRKVLERIGPGLFVGGDLHLELGDLPVTVAEDCEVKGAIQIYEAFLSLIDLPEALRGKVTRPAWNQLPRPLDGPW